MQAYSVSPSMVSTFKMLIALSLIVICLMLLLSDTLSGFSYCPTRDIMSKSSTSLYFVIIGEARCPACSTAKNLLEQFYGSDSIVFADVGVNRFYAELYRAVDDVLNLNIRSTYDRYPIPFIVVLKNGTIKGFIVGIPLNRTQTDSILESEELVIFYADKDRYRVLENNDLLNDLLYSLNDCSLHGGLQNYKRITLAFVASLALLDSINPCDFAVLASMVASIALTSGRRRALVAAASFVLASFTVYVSIGAGLIWLFTFIPLWIGPVVAIIYGIYVTASSVSNLVRTSRSVCRDSTYYEGRNPVIMAFLLGLTVSMTLAPCTAGPYFIFSSLASTLDKAARILYLLLYNVIFITPMTVIGVSAALMSTSGTFKRIFVSANEEYLRLAAGIATIVIGVYILVTFAI